MYSLILAGAASVSIPGDTPAAPVQPGVQPPVPADRDFPQLDAWIADQEKRLRQLHPEYEDWLAAQRKKGHAVLPDFNPEEASLKKLRRFRRERTTPWLERRIADLEDEAKWKRVWYERLRDDLFRQGKDPLPPFSDIFQVEEHLKALRALRGKTEAEIDAGIRRVSGQIGVDFRREREALERVQKKYKRPYRW